MTERRSNSAQGSLTANDNALKADELAQFEREDDAVALRAESTSRILLLTGEPLNEPVAGQGPFVMNTRDEIRQAVRDYQAGKTGTLA